MNVLFVCTGNINRSAAGESILNTYITKYNISDIKVDSSGLNEESAKSRKINNKTKTILKEKNLLFDENKRSNFSSKERVDWADVIIVMQPSHKKNLLSMYPHIENKIHFAIEYLDDCNLKNIPDPNFSKGTDEFYYVVYLMEKVVINFLKKNGYAIYN